MLIDEDIYALKVELEFLEDAEDGKRGGFGLGGALQVEAEDNAT